MPWSRREKAAIPTSRDRTPNAWPANLKFAVQPLEFPIQLGPIFSPPLMPPTPTRAKRRLAKLILVLFGFAIGALIAEVSLRIVHYSYPEFYQRDPVVGVSLLPGATGWYRREGQSYVVINGDGLRDIEHAIVKPPNTFRIALIGDSYCEAFPVQQPQAFWSVMQRDLQDCDAAGGKQIEVINFGVSGYGTAQELLTLREKVWKYSPDMVLLAITTNNDITDNSRELKRTNDVPYFVYKNDQLVLDDSFKTSRDFQFAATRTARLGNWLRTHSRLVQAITQAHHGFKILLASWRASHSNNQAPSANGSPSGKTDLYARAQELGTDNLVYLEPNNAVWNDAWRVTEGLIVQMRDEVQSHGAKFLVVTLSNGPQVLPDPAAREAFKQRFGISDLFYPDNRIKALGQRAHFDVLSLAPELQLFAETSHTFLHGFGSDIGNGHWNQQGNKAAGELLARKICEDGLLK